MCEDLITWRRLVANWTQSYSLRGYRMAVCLSVRWSHRITVPQGSARWLHVINYSHILHKLCQYLILIKGILFFNVQTIRVNKSQNSCVAWILRGALRQNILERYEAGDMRICLILVKLYYSILLCISNYKRVRNVI